MNLGFWNGINTKSGLGILGGGGAVSYTISGTVYDADGTTAVEGATVALGAYSATSAANGTYTIADVPEGTSGSMTCTKTGYVWAAKTIAAMSGNLTSQNYTNAWYAAAGAGASCVIAYKPLGAADLATSYINIVNPGTYNATPVVAPSFAGATGWGFAGAQSLETGLTLTATTSTLVRFAGAAASSGVVIGLKTTGTRYRIYPRAGGNLYYSFKSSNEDANTAGAGVTAGVIALTADGIYVDGVSREAVTESLTAEEIVIGRDAAGSYFASSGTIAAVAIYSTTLTAEQVTAVSAAMNGL